ncbi:MAG: hypothetical protein HN738_08495 [Gammaproteobacteria bacterium]|jgi:hypothetical protein|nr:hypothetical protein [Gammaproteobacteria bacterium]
MQKKCFKCGVERPLSEFYKHKQMADGHLGKCKECTCRDVRTNRKDKVEHYREYDKQRFQTDPRRLAALKAHQKKWQGANRIKKGASTMVCNAVRDGRLYKPDDCSECKATPDMLHGHHDDYSQPLVVRWLCAICHSRWHKENGEGLNG